jgi:two-component system, NtrC family, sensor kinase
MEITMNTDGAVDRSYYRSLTQKMISIVILVSVAPLILVGGIIFDQFNSIYQEKIYAHIEELVAKHRQAIDSFLTEKERKIQFVAESFTYDQLTDEAFLAQRLKHLQKVFSLVFVDMGIVDANGRQIAYAGPFDLRDADYSEAGWFKEAVRKPHHVSDVFMGLRGSPHFIVTVRKTAGDQLWILRATIDFVSFNDLVERIRIGQTGFAYILNNAGVFQTQPRQQALVPAELKPASANAELRRSDNIIVGEFDVENGDTYVTASAALKGGDWHLVYRQKRSDAFSALTKAQVIALLIFCSGGLGIVLMAVFLSRQMVSRIRKADSEKELMNRQVIETGKLASIGQLAAGIAHEINNPVAIMVEEAGWIEDLLGDPEPFSAENIREFHRALKQINIQGVRCKEITHKLLSFARKTDSRLQEIQPNDLIREMVALAEQRARYANVQIVSHNGTRIPTIKGSVSEMQQVMLNLINNALQAMDKDGGTLELSTRVAGSEVVIDVRDDGPGIPPALISRVFDPFFTTKPVGAGTGLGLSICYGIVSRMDGRIEVSSQVGRGTTFSICLPIDTSKVFPENPSEAMTDQQKGEPNDGSQHFTGR